jgi:catechol 2,3-dioxygenase-like lactoylglutathione lyase family enzyme
MQPTPAQQGPTLVGVTIGSTDLPRHSEVYAAIAGVAPMVEPPDSGPVAGEGSGGPAEQAVLFALGDARVVLAPAAAGGLRQLCIRVASVNAAARRLQAAGATFGCRDGRVVVDHTWSAVQVALVEQPLGPELGSSAGAALDHVAVLVADVAAMARRWAVLLGIEPDHVGVHPLGTSRAARFLLDDRMIELLSPLEGQVPALHERLRRAGDGPFALALIGPDSEATRAAVAASGARVLHHPPHWIVHPVDAAGVPVQITPRVHH